MRSAVIFILLLWLIIEVNSSSAKNLTNNNQTMRIQLYWQKTPREQHLYAPNLKKYGIKFPILGKHHYGGNRTNDSIALYRFLDHQFYGKIVIGHPGQTLNVAFDTAWTYSWVLSSKCSSLKSIGCYFHNKYDHTKSSEYHKDGRPFIINEGTYNLTGFFSYDNISIAHSNATNQSFVEMVSVPYTFLFNKADGVLGLGLKNDPSYDPFFYTLVKQKKIKNNLFSIYLNRDTQSNRGGNIMLGFIDDKHIHKNRINNKTIPENITYLSVVNSNTYWQFQIDQILIDLKKEGNITLCKNGCLGVSDTSSNTIYGPEDEVAEIHDAIKAKEILLGRYTVNCDTVNKLPPIYFTLAGKPFVLKGEDYISKLSYHSITICLSAFEGANTPYEQGRWILGGAFLSKYYSIYDVTNKKIGFVTAAK